MNFYAVRAIYKFEMSRFWRTWLQSVISPVIYVLPYKIQYMSMVGSHMGREQCLTPDHVY